MPISWPYAFDALTNPAAADKTNSSSVPHAEQHANINDIAEALERKVGLSDSGIAGSSAASTMPGDVLFVGDSSGRTRWGPRARVCLAQSNSTAPVASVTFSAIPQNYRHLWLTTLSVSTSASTSFEDVFAVVNGDTSAIYSQQNMVSFATTVSGSEAIKGNSFRVGQHPHGGASYGPPAGGHVTILDYASTVKKMGVTQYTVITSTNSGSMRSGQTAFVIDSTAPVTSLTISAAGGFATGARFSLYGDPNS